MAKRDTLDKIVLYYFAAITTHPLVWRGETIDPFPLKVSSNLLRGFTCPSGCGGCCPTFSLDYLSNENHPYNLTKREVELNGRPIEIWSDLQEENRGMRCKNLTSEGRCGIHERNPFACDFELIRFTKHPSYWSVSERLFSRGWAMQRTDGGKGALCTVPPPTKESALDVARRLKRLSDWADYFGLENHRTPTLITYCQEFAEFPEKAPEMIFK